VNGYEKSSKMAHDGCRPKVKWEIPVAPCCDLTKSCGEPQPAVPMPTGNRRKQHRQTEKGVLLSQRSTWHRHGSWFVALAAFAIGFVLCAITGAAVTALGGADQIQWLGPNRNGVIEAGVVDRFSDELSPYPVHPTSQTLSVDQIYQRTTPGRKLGPKFAKYRREIIAMYKAAGVDISMDPYEQRMFVPKNYSRQTPQPLRGEFKQPYSVDSPFYHKAPAKGVALPPGYIGSFHIATVGPGGDGWGIGVVISTGKDPLRKIVQTWNKAVPAKGDREVTMHVRKDALDFAPANKGDKHLTFIDTANLTVLHTWVVGKYGDVFTGYRAYGSHPLGTLGIGEGTTATQIAELVGLLRAGEATDPAHPIPHALFGPGRRYWKAVVYPAVNWDEWVGKSNGGDGLVPYGGLVRLDPQLKLSAMNLSLPALRILEAIQNYG